MSTSNIPFFSKAFLLAGLLTGALIFAGTCISIYHNYNFVKPFTGDESYYVPEARYLAENGLLHSLKEGTSPSVSIAIIVIRKLFGLDWVSSGRIASIIGYIIFISGLIFLLIHVNFLPWASKTVIFLLSLLIISNYIGLATFTDVPAFGLVFWGIGFYLKNSDELSPKSSLRSLYLFGFFLSLAATVRPTIFILFLSILVSLFLWHLVNGKYRSGIRETFYLTLGFLTLTGPMLFPSIWHYGSIKMENKELTHPAEGAMKSPLPISWVQRNTYYVLHRERHQKPNKWQIGVSEVKGFIDGGGLLPLSYSEYVRNHFGVFISETLKKAFIDFPYILTTHTPLYILIKMTLKLAKPVRQVYLFFTALIFWTIIVAALYYSRATRWWRDSSNLLLFSAGIYTILISAYTIAHLEINWLIYPIVMLTVVFFRWVNSPNTQGMIHNALHGLFLFTIFISSLNLVF